MKLAEINIEMHGPVAIHNYPCPVCRSRHAVLDLSTGVMQPCWVCRDVGWMVRKPWLWWLRKKPGGAS